MQLDPMTKLRNYMEENNLRLVDFFNQFDQDHSMSVTREEFKIGVEVPTDYFFINRHFACNKYSRRRLI